VLTTVYVYVYAGNAVTLSLCNYSNSGKLFVRLSVKLCLKHGQCATWLIDYAYQFVLILHVYIVTEMFNDI